YKKPFLAKKVYEQMFNKKQKDDFRVGKIVFFNSKKMLAVPLYHIFIHWKETFPKGSSVVIKSLLCFVVV
ncbi:hypothetical protein, partial [Peribacillus frigoritolerans]|uniref:hypothetical protein n=1 Tax=Peribacillus frigoritolerans TaxID=450367 RepID=UPI00301A4911